MDKGRGTTRNVIPLGARMVIKVPVRARLRDGMRSNRLEVTRSRLDHRYCPVWLSLPFGLGNVMPRASPLSQQEFDWLGFMFFYRFIDDYQTNQVLQIEMKPDTFGRIKHRLVILDFGDPDD